MSRLAPYDFSLYLVTDTAQCARAGRTVAETAALAVAGGAGVVQVRDKTASDAEFRVLVEDVLDAIARVRRAEGIAREVPVFVNDRVRVARDLGRDGRAVHVHIGQSDAPPAEVRDLLGPAPLIGLSAATSGELRAARESGAVDLVGIGPAYDTATKADAPSGIGPERIALLAAEAGLPGVAIGGIDAARAAELRGTGVVGVCAVSAICLAEDPREASARMRAAFTGE